MPTYAYACTACGHSFDVHQSFTDDPLTVCPQCEGRLRKVISSVGVTFKGSGFYRTDSRAEKRASVGRGSGPSESAGGKSAKSSESGSSGSKEKSKTTAGASSAA